MRNTPIDYQTVKQKIEESGIKNVGTASIRELLKIVSQIEADTGEKFIRMEMGVPGLPPSKIGIEAEIEAHKKGVAAIYPNIEGIPELKTEIVRFLKLFLNIDVSPSGCIPTVGSMLGGFASFMTLGRLYKEKDTTLFIDPGFPVQKQQHRVLGQKYESFDVYNYRGAKLREKLESYLRKGNIVSIIYSNPNNPSWICFTDEELKTIAELADLYNVVVIEDLAYFGMDFRKDYTQPGVAPYQPSVSQYTDNYILLISSSKIFSYAGQRIGMLVVSDKVFNIQSAHLKSHYSTDVFGHALIFGSIYALSSGTSHSPQYGLAAILKAVNEGTYHYREDVIDYAEKASIMKKLFLENGFKIVYDTDIDKPIADGFYFTISYAGYTGELLVEELLYYGISAISLAITGSERLEGVRACVSLVNRKQFPELEQRLIQFHKDHPVNPL
ncbi:MAG: pyridoxal phosphate-dependent aminotransferase [Bacteroidetes bacterium]|nr:pyridoxal phosphate-dependent aminotransferase [Bacteroidota bacterium]MBL6963995.1 pyridoxal phosphate-dependent aminotransferase [Bacteroidota bacterium]